MAVGTDYGTLAKSIFHVCNSNQSVYAYVMSYLGAWTRYEAAEWPVEGFEDRHPRMHSFLIAFLSEESSWQSVS